MAGQTPRFALNFFGGDTPGSLDDDADKFTGEDRLTIDRILAAFENHNHRVAASLDVPDADPDVQLGTAGTLAAGTTYYYVVSFLNAQGLETPSGPEVSVDTPDLLEASDAPQGTSSTVTANTLTAGQYYYALTGLRAGEESPLGDPTTVTVLEGENTVSLVLPALGDADNYQVWRMKDTDPQWTRIVTTNTGTATDDGSIPPALYGDPANTAPTDNTGVDKYSVTITLTGDDLTSLPTTSGWRIYRTDTSGLYSSASLVHEVIERTDDTNPSSPLLSSWIDTGDAQLTGSPKLFSNELLVAPYTFEENSPLPAASGYPQNYPMLDGAGVLYMNRSGTWTPVSGTRGVALFTGTGNPTGAEPSGSRAGDVFIDTTSGDIYLLSGS